MILIYGSLDGVKKWLPEVSGSQFDSELTSCLEAASSQFEALIKQRVNPDFLTPYFKNEIGKACEMYAAGLFRAKRQRGEQIYIDGALRWLNSLLSLYIDFRKTEYRE